MGNSIYEKKLEHYRGLPREEIDRLFVERAEQIRQQRIEATLPDGVGSDAISGIMGVHTLRECINDLLIFSGIERPRN